MNFLHPKNFTLCFCFVTQIINVKYKLSKQLQEVAILIDNVIEK